MFSTITGQGFIFYWANDILSFLIWKQHQTNISSDKKFRDTFSSILRFPCRWHRTPTVPSHTSFILIKNFSNSFPNVPQFWYLSFKQWICKLDREDQVEEFKIIIIDNLLSSKLIKINIHFKLKNNDKFSRQF